MAEEIKRGALVRIIAGMPEWKGKEGFVQSFVDGGVIVHCGVHSGETVFLLREYIEGPIHPEPVATPPA